MLGRPIRRVIKGVPPVVDRDAPRDPPVADGPAAAPVDRKGIPDKGVALKRDRDFDPGLVGGAGIPPFRGGPRCDRRRASSAAHAGGWGAPAPAKPSARSPSSACTKSPRIGLPSCLPRGSSRSACRLAPGRPSVARGPDPLRDVKGKGGVAALVGADVVAVDPYLGGVVDGAKVQEASHVARRQAHQRHAGTRRSRALPCCRCRSTRSDRRRGR